MTGKNTIQSSFDRLALFDSDGWDHNSYYHPYLLKQYPPNCDKSPEIGCGTGSLSRILSRNANQVLALDLSPKMIEIAKLRSIEYPNIEYQVVDVMD